MKSVIIESFGDTSVLTVANVNDPQLKSGEVLVDVHVAGINPLDTKIRAGYLKALSGENFPIQMGSDIAGVVKATAEDVTVFTKGDRVFGTVNQFYKGGALSQQVATSANHLALLPDSMEFYEAAAIPTVSLTAIQAIRDYITLPSGSDVLIAGASGNVGTLAIQFAKKAGWKVYAMATGVNINMVSERGADHVIDYRSTNIGEITQTFDAVFDFAGIFSTESVAKAVLKENGSFVTTVRLPN